VVDPGRAKRRKSLLAVARDGSQRFIAVELAQA